MDEMEELRQEFLSEGYELLNTMEDGILKLEKDPKDNEAINGIFRVAHTLKGGAASLELTRIANFTHELENLFDKVRDGLILVNEEIIDIILKSLDILKAMVDAAAKNIEPEEGIEVETLGKIIAVQKEQEEGEDSSIKQGDALKNQPEPVKGSLELNEYELEKVKEAQKQNMNIHSVVVQLNPEYAMRSVSGLQIYTALKEIGEIISCFPHIDTILEEEFVSDIQLVLSSELDKDRVHSKIFLSDVTLSVDVEAYAPGEASGLAEAEKTETEARKTFGDEVKQAISENLAKGKPVFKVEVEIEKDNPMRNVDSLLIYNTLEETGEVLYSHPTKEDLRADKFFQHLEVIIVSDSTKDRVKEKCSISGTTKSVKVSVFKPKNQAAVNQEQSQSSGSESQAVAEKETSPVNNTQSQAPAQDRNKQAKAQGGASAPKSFLRVESGRVDTLMNLVSELVISKAGLIETAQQILNVVENLRSTGTDARKLMDETQLNSESQYEQERVQKIYDFFDLVTKSSWNELDNFENIINIISRVINELQESVMKIRMVPISSIFNRFPRIVRDLSRSLNKKVDIEIYGEDTELDKSVIEELLDPLVHMVRNSIDHGVESPQDRLQRGKAETGKVILGASHEGSMIKIEIADDGNGLNADRIKASAIEKGLISENKELSKEEVLNLIFQAGFSTAASVTEVSGRGVGMDVVKKKIENLSGSIFVETDQGKGTKFIIKIPLTLAIIQALTVEINTYSYSIPINNIVETLTITEDQIEMFENNQVIRLRNELITIINLKEIFNFKSEKDISEDEIGQQEAANLADADFQDSGDDELDKLAANEKYIVVVEMSNKKAGFLVDTVIAEQDIVIKPLHKKYAMTKGISGATILGDGRISLIIDIYQLIDMYIKKEEYISIK